MSNQRPFYVAAKEGREARKAGRPRKSPYENIPALKAFHQPWLDGWDTMERVERRELAPEETR